MAELNKLVGFYDEKELPKKLRKLKATAKKQKLKDWALDVKEVKSMNIDGKVVYRIELSWPKG